MVVIIIIVIIILLVKLMANNYDGNDNCGGSNIGDDSIDTVYDDHKRYVSFILKIIKL